MISPIQSDNPNPSYTICTFKKEMVSSPTLSPTNTNELVNLLSRTLQYNQHYFWNLPTVTYSPMVKERPFFSLIFRTTCLLPFFYVAYNLNTINYKVNLWFIICVHVHAHLKKLLDSDWLRTVQFKFNITAESNTSANYNDIWRLPKIVQNLPKITKDQTKPSEDFQMSSEHFRRSPEYVRRFPKITRILPKISEDHPNTSKDSRRSTE